MNIPTHFKIGGLDFTVEIVDNLNNGSDYGMYNDAINKIIIANRIKVNDIWHTIPEQNKFSTFFHELFHVFHYMWNTETPEDEAQVYANFMLEYEQTKV